MRKLILDMLKEESNLDYMGVRLSDIKSSLPKQYLVKNTRELKNQDIQKERLKTISDKVNILYKQIDTELKSLKWEDIRFTYKKVNSHKINRLEGFFYVVLPPKIKNKMMRLSSFYGELLDVDYLNLITPKEKINQLFLDYENLIVDDYIFMYVDSPRNRTHFPEGLPKSLLGYDIGIKIYRKLLDRLGFIQSEPNATQSVQSIYRRLVESPEVNTIIYEDLVLIIDKTVSKEEKIRILEESIHERYKTKYSRRLVLGRTILLDSSLKKQIGEKRVLDTIDRLFYEARGFGHEPFSGIKYKKSKPKKLGENFVINNLILIL